jgi:hypothetical protein
VADGIHLHRPPARAASHQPECERKGASPPEALAFPLREAQEIIALEAGYASWAALKVAVGDEPLKTKPASPTLRLTRAVPVIPVASVPASAAFSGTLSVSRSISCTVNRRFMAPCRATVRVYMSSSCTSRYSRLARKTGMDSLKRQAWGGRDFIVRDPDGNGMCFAGPPV